jgi:hypothetical protein
MYSKASEEEDNKMAESWQKDADGILIFVSPHVGFRISLCVKQELVDRFILSLRRCLPFRDHPRPEAKQSGYLSVLSWEHL